MGTLRGTTGTWVEALCGWEVSPGGGWKQVALGGLGTGDTVGADSQQSLPPPPNSCFLSQDGGTKAEQGGGQFTDAGPGLVTHPHWGSRHWGGSTAPRGPRHWGASLPPLAGEPKHGGVLPSLCAPGVFVCLGLPGGLVGRGRRGKSHPTPPPHSPLYPPPPPHAPLSPCPVWALCTKFH